MSKTTCQSDFRWFRNLLQKVCCLSVYLSALTHPCNVLIKSNITRKRFDAGYSNLEHWSYLIHSTIRPDMTPLTISGHVSAAILKILKTISHVNISKLAQHKFTKFEILIDSDVFCVSSTHDTYRLIHSSGITQKLFQVRKLISRKQLNIY